MIFRRLTSLSIRHSSWVIALWLLVTAISVPFAVRLPSVLGDHGLTTDGQYAQVQKMLDREFQMPDEPIVLVFENVKSLPHIDFQSSVSDVLVRIGRIGGVTISSPPVGSPRKVRAEYVPAVVSVLPGSSGDKKKALDRIREEISDASGIEVRMTGKPVVQEDVNRLSGKDLAAAERIGLPVAFVLLTYALGGVVPAMIPLAAGGISVLMAMGVMYGIGYYGGLSLSVFVYNVIPMVGMAVCIDFALLMVSRYREESQRLSVSQAIMATMATSGRTVAVSAACVILALIGTFYIRMPIFNSVALGTLAVIAISLLVNLTFVPALLFVWRQRFVSHRTRRSIPGGGTKFWRGFVATMMKRPLTAAFLAILLLTICIYPIHSMQVGVPGPESLPKEREARQAAEAVSDKLQTNRFSQAFVIVESNRATRIRSDLEQDPAVLRIESAKSNMDNGHLLLTVWLRGKESSKEAMNWVREHTLRYAAFGALIGGEPKYHQEVHEEIQSRMKYVLLFVIVSNFIVLAAAFRSLLIPLKAIAMILIGIGASYGILSWLFQEGRFGLEPTDIAIMIPVFIFGLAFGISMDYGIFLLSRIYERYRETGDHEQAIREGMASSGKIIVSAATIMIAVTAPFALAGVSGVKQLGIGIATALFLDATIIRMVLVPSLMKYFGKWNWWLPFMGN
ncbi:MMPL family transporter [Cohnella terricola]|uniref:MMPL family transporter n=1 Tax=Cohnella terricola TaxID=1289167 RepID=A0A559JQP9_9BACL|nr:MMPL family transporter [Cohnella terricola]TVY02187.1 MMPL family transporter [Cohnella terricola]